MIKRIGMMAALSAVMLASGCASYNEWGSGPGGTLQSDWLSYSKSGNDQFVALASDAVDSVAVQLEDVMLNQGRAVSRTTPFVVGSMQMSGQLGTTGAMGRALTEAVSSRMAQKGYLVKEFKFQNSMAIAADGERALSAEMARNEDIKGAPVAVVGTYSPAGTMIYVTVKAVRVADGAVLGSKSYTLPRSTNFEGLLGNK